MSLHPIRNFSVASALLAIGLFSPLCPAQTAPPVAQSTSPLPDSPIPQSSISNRSGGPQPVSTPAQAADERRARAAAQLKLEEKQRILGVVPNFNTIEMDQAVPLSPRQKFQLMFKGSVDPAIFFLVGLNGAIGQAEDDFQGYGQGWGAYGKRVGASYADTVDGNFWGNAVFPVLLHEDPRYFRKGKGPIKKRVLYSVATTFRTRTDSGKWVPNYGNIAGNLVSGGISNLYYPSTDRGLALTLANASTVTAEGAIGALLFEFWPDISRKLSRKHRTDSPPPAAPAISALAAPDNP